MQLIRNGLNRWLFRTDGLTNCYKHNPLNIYILRLTQYEGMQSRVDYWVQLLATHIPGLNVRNHYRFEFTVVVPGPVLIHEIPLDSNTFSGDWQARVYARKASFPLPPNPFPIDFNFGTEIFFEGAQKLDGLI